MKAEEKVKEMFPNAIIERVAWRLASFHFRVTIKPGRYAYGRMKSWAWVSALESIAESHELSREALRPLKAEPVPPKLPPTTQRGES